MFFEFDTHLMISYGWEVNTGRVFDTVISYSTALIV